MRQRTTTLHELPVNQLLPVGCVNFQVTTDNVLRESSPLHYPLKNALHSFLGNTEHSTTFAVTPPSSSLNDPEWILDCIDYLCQHNFIRIEATLTPLNRCIASPSDTNTTHDVRIRVFLVPEDIDGRRDLPLRPTSKSFQVKSKEYMRRLLEVLDASPITWKSADSNVASSCKTSLIQDFTFASKRLGEIYASLPSPAPSITQERLKTLPKHIFTCLKRAQTTSAPKGMRTVLYRYQQNSLNRLLEREVCPQLMIDPQFIKCQTVDGQEFWLDVQNWNVWKSPVYWDDVKGGIICEDMGTGKTCICIALILSTLNQMPELPVEYPLECEVNLFEEQIDDDHLDFMDIDSVPSLRNLTVQTIRRQIIPFDGDLLPPHLNKLLQNSPPFYYKLPAEEMRSMRYKTQANRFRVFLSHVTLVVVPDNLVDQWRTEINKHVSGESALKVLVLSDFKTPIPSPETLIKYDLILISHPRFAHEYQSASEFTFGSNVSPLLQVHFLRIIVDEGHTLSAHTSNGTILASKLHVDRKWICTGTPMPWVLANVARQDVEKKDLDRFERLCEFLQVKPVMAQKNGFKVNFAKPHLNGIYPFHIPLENLMKRLMVRNQPAKIAAEVSLPPLFERIVKLNMTPVQSLIYNVLVCFKLVNEITSERSDIDYLLHPRNAKYLNSFMNNLRTSTSWFAGLERHDIQTTIVNIDRYIGRTNKQCTEEDLELLMTCKNILSEALNDTAFQRCALEEKELHYWVHGLSQLGLTPWKNQNIVTSLHGNEHEAVFCTALELEQQRYRIEKARLAKKKQGERALPSNQEELLLPEILALPPRIRSLEQSELSTVRLLTSTSSKLNYLISELKRHATNGEKCIVYSQAGRFSSNEMFYVHEMLRLAKIRCLLFHRDGMQIKERSANITTFNTSANISVFVMDLDAAAYGIDLHTATRVYFLSPIWENGKERQAIKRAHRIGSTKPVYVETLVIADTIEEEILHLKGDLNEDGLGSKGLEKEISSKIRQVASNIRLAPVTGYWEILKEPLPVFPTSRRIVEDGQVIDDVDVYEEHFESRLTPMPSPPPTPKQHHGTSSFWDSLKTTVQDSPTSLEMSIRPMTSTNKKKTGVKRRKPEKGKELEPKDHKRRKSEMVKNPPDSPQTLQLENSKSRNIVTEIISLAEM